MLNNDTEAEPGWLEALVTGLMAQPEAGSAASKMLLFDRRDTLHTAGDMMGKDGIPRNRGVWEKDEGQYDQDRWVFGPCGGAAAYRREAWTQAGGFDPALFMYMEDVDLAWRLQMLGWKSIYVPEARVTTSSAPPAAGRWPATTPAEHDLGHRFNWPGELLKRHWREIVRAQLRIAIDALRAWRGEAARSGCAGR